MGDEMEPFIDLGGWGVRVTYPQKLVFMGKKQV